MVRVALFEEYEHSTCLATNFTNLAVMDIPNPLLGNRHHRTTASRQTVATTRTSKLRFTEN
jgi:hypothetical protein